MTATDPIDYDVVNAVCLKKMATATAIAAATGHPDDVVSQAIARLLGGGLIADVGGTYLPTDAASPQVEEWAAQRYAAARQDAAVQEAADRFEPVNKAFLEAMSAWQMINVGGRQLPNDHTDQEYDDKVVDRIDRLVQRLGPVLGVLEKHDPRFAAYSQRFEVALDQVSRGQSDYVSLPTVDSVHNVWFEFHEDLLRTLGRQREE